MSFQYQKLDMVAQLGKDLPVEEQQRLAAQQPQPALTNTLDPTLATNTLETNTLAPTTTMASPLAGAPRAPSTHSFATAADDMEDVISEDSLTVSPESKRAVREPGPALALHPARGPAGRLPAV